MVCRSVCTGLKKLIVDALALPLQLLKDAHELLSDRMLIELDKALHSRGVLILGHVVN